MTEEKYSYFVGLDIGTTAVRCVVGELAGGAANPSIIGFSEVENIGMRKGMVAHGEETVGAITKAIEEAERMSGRHITSATINVNGTHVQGINSKGVIAISSPDRQITHDDLVRVEEAATIVQLPPNKDIIQVFAKNYQLDGQDNIKDPIGMHGVRLEVDTHIVVGSVSALRNLDQVLEKAQLHPSHRTVSALAAAEITLDRKQRESGVAVLDIGAATTNIAVIEDGEVEHIAVIPMGGNHITNDLAIGLKTDLEIAEEVKIKHASLAPSAKGDLIINFKKEAHRFDRELVRMIVEARVEEIFDFVDAEFKKIGKSRKLPGGVMMVGGTSKLPGLADFAKEKLELPARVGDWRHIEQVIDGVDKQRFATAVGLMMMDMLLGPAQRSNYVDHARPNILDSVSNFAIGDSLKKLLKRK